MRATMVSIHSPLARADSKIYQFYTANFIYYIQLLILLIKLNTIIFTDILYITGKVDKFQVRIPLQILVIFTSALNYLEFSLLGTQNIGRIFAIWISNFQLSTERVTINDFDCIIGTPNFTGYISQQFNKYRKRETKAYENWIEQIPLAIDKYIIKTLSFPVLSKYDLIMRQDNYKIAKYKNYNSLIPLAQAAPKPIFELHPYMELWADIYIM